MKVVKSLFGKDANHLVREAQTNNNILHLAAKHCVNHEVLEYVVKNAKIDIFERNSSGDTALTIAQAGNNTKAVEIIEECQDLLDETGKKTDELMTELMGEEKKDEKRRER